MPAATPTKRPRANSNSVDAPSSSEPTNSRLPTGSRVVREVLMERISTWLTDMLTMAEMVCRSPRSVMFSWILSNTTTVSYSE